MICNGEFYISLLQKTSPNAVELARLLSLAARIEPELIRAMRLNLLPPNIEAGVEADLWFSPLIQASSPLGIVFRPDVLWVLRRQLVNEEERMDLEKTWTILCSIHKNAPPAVRIEERVTYLSLIGSSKEIINEALKPALAALFDKTNEKNRDGIARWARRVLPRLPEKAVETDVAHILDIGAARQEGGQLLLGNPSMQHVNLIERNSPKIMDPISIGVRLIRTKQGNKWVFSYPPKDAINIIESPKIDPIIIEVTGFSNNSNKIETRQIIFRNSAIVHDLGDKIQVRTGGVTYVLNFPRPYYSLFY